MPKYYITFGQGHRHIIQNKKLDKDTVAVIEAATQRVARDKAFKLFGDQFFTTYTETTWDKQQLHHFSTGYIYLEDPDIYKHSRKLGRECVEYMKDLNPKGGMNEFIRIAAQYGYQKGCEASITDTDFIINLLNKWRDTREQLVKNMNTYKKTGDTVLYEQTFHTWNQCNLIIFDLKDVLSRRGIESGLEYPPSNS